MMKKNKTPIIIIISFILGLLLIACAFIIIHNYNKSKYEEAQERFVVVKQVNKDSIIVEDSVSKETKTYLTDGEDYHEGDLVSITTKGDKVEDHKVIVEEYNKMTKAADVIIEETTTVPTTSNITTTNTTTTSKANVVRNTTVKSTTVVKTTTTSKTTTKDEIVLRQVESDYKAIKSSSDNSTTFKENAKKKFIEIVDFIYYDGKIKGITFKELKDTTKGKIVYYALLLDAAIDTKFPGYKENISDKYKDIKSKLLAEYLEVKYEVCIRSNDDCEQFNADFQLLKTSLKLTWDIIKACFMYVKNLTVPKIQAWYESFRG